MIHITVKQKKNIACKIILKYIFSKLYIRKITIVSSNNPAFLNDGRSWYTGQEGQGDAPCGLSIWCICRKSTASTWCCLSPPAARMNGLRTRVEVAMTPLASAYLPNWRTWRLMHLEVLGSTEAVILPGTNSYKTKWKQNVPFIWGPSCHQDNSLRSRCPHWPWPVGYYHTVGFTGSYPSFSLSSM